MRSITLHAPAKVNLFLKVYPKRPDGYHDLFTLFERIDLCDTITISGIPSGIEVVSDVPITLDPRDNLVYKAAILVLKRAKIRRGVRIRIRKRIPIAGGLGGGSSDAASTLIGITRLYRTGLSPQQLIRIGAGLGADIPFFLLDRPVALGTGKGDQLMPLPRARKWWHVVVNPGFGVSTKEVYGAYDRMAPARLTGSRHNDKIPRYCKIQASSDSFETMMSNDLEPVVVRKHKVIGTIIQRLAIASGRKALLSGSGPSVFCLCPTRKEAMITRRRFLSSPSATAHGWQVFVAGTKV